MRRGEPVVRTAAQNEARREREREYKRARAAARKAAGLPVNPSRKRTPEGIERRRAWSREHQRQVRAVAAGNALDALATRLVMLDRGLTRADVAAEVGVTAGRFDQLMLGNDAGRGRVEDAIERLAGVPSGVVPLRELEIRALMHSDIPRAVTTKGRRYAASP